MVLSSCTPSSVPSVTEVSGLLPSKKPLLASQVLSTPVFDLSLKFLPKTPRSLGAYTQWVPLKVRSRSLTPQGTPPQLFPEQVPPQSPPLQQYNAYLLHIPS